MPLQNVTCCSSEEESVTFEMIMMIYIDFVALVDVECDTSMAKQDSRRLDAGLVGMAQDFKSRFQSEYTDQPGKRSL